MSIEDHAGMFPGPNSPNFCMVDPSITHDGQPGVDLNCLCSVGVLLRVEGTCGEDQGDAELEQIKASLIY